MSGVVIGRPKDVSSLEIFLGKNQLFLTAENLQVCHKAFLLELAKQQHKHYVCSGDQYMLVKMDLSEEPKLKMLNEKNQTFTRVAKYFKDADHLLVLLFTSYKFNVKPEEVYERYQKMFTEVSPKGRLMSLMSFFNDYSQAYRGSFVFVPPNKGQNLMSRFIPQ